MNWKIVEKLPDGLISLSLPDFRLLVPLSHDVLKSGTDDSSLELVGALCPLLGGLFFETLPVLPAVQHGPVDLAGVALQEVGAMAAAIQKPEGLKGTNSRNILVANPSPIRN